MIHIEPSIQKLRSRVAGFGASFDVDWWRQAGTLFVVEVSVRIHAFPGGRVAKLRIGCGT